MFVGNLHTNYSVCNLQTEFYIRIYFICNKYCLKKFIYKFFFFSIYYYLYILFLFLKYSFFKIIFTISLVSFINNVHHVRFEPNAQQN